MFSLLLLYLEVLWAGFVKLGLVHFKHGVEDNGRASETDAGATQGHPYISLHGIGC